MVADTQSVGDYGERGIHRSARYEEAAVNDIEIVHVVCAAVEIKDRSLRVFAEFAGADLVTEAVHRHFSREVAGLGGEIVHLRHYVAAATDFSEDAFPSLRQPVERLDVVLGVINNDPLITLDADLVLRFR